MPYYINNECIGCTICAKKCPVPCIWGGEVHVWDVLAERDLMTFQQRGAPSYMAFSPDNKTLATLDTDGTILIWDVARKAP